MIFIRGSLWEFFFGDLGQLSGFWEADSEISVWLSCSHGYFPVEKRQRRSLAGSFILPWKQPLHFLELLSHQQWQLHLVPWQDTSRSIFNLHESTDLHRLFSFFAPTPYHCFPAWKRHKTEGKFSLLVPESRLFLLSDKFCPLLIAEDHDHFLKRLKCMKYWSNFLQTYIVGLTSPSEHFFFL